MAWEYKGTVTCYLFWTCLVASSGGVSFGYMLGISDVIRRGSFLKVVLSSEIPKVKHDNHELCSFDGLVVVLYMIAYISAILVSALTISIGSLRGRQALMFISGVSFCGGVIFSCITFDNYMFFISREILGFSFGITCQVVPLYLSEMAPANIRGMISSTFYLMITVGFLAGNIVNYFTAKISTVWDWRVSFGGAIVPGFLFAVGTFYLPDSPNSLIFHGHASKAWELLVKIRGTQEVELEYSDLVAAKEVANQVIHPWRDFCMQRRYRPQLIMSFMIPIFQQLAGNSVIVFYAPVLFKRIGIASFPSVVLYGCTSVAAALLCAFTVDKLGRKIICFVGGMLMLVCMCILSYLSSLEQYTYGIVIVICIYCFGFSLSWGPLGWLIPSEIFSLEIRSHAQSFSVSINMLFALLLPQIFLTQLCHIKYAHFIFFGACVASMTFFFYFFVPETNVTPIEKMMDVWKGHWFWRRYIPDKRIDRTGISGMGQGA